MSNNVVQLIATPDEEFGGCPRCGKNDGYINLGRQHWSICRTHKTKWWIGDNLFSSWRNESPEQRAANVAQLASYRTVEPLEVKEEQRRAAASGPFPYEAPNNPDLI